ncbi:MAG: SUMF1/EgtB/PvdO family nonheme iron enzyme, partial [bacterium]|nr:SUMF1/EgtB/PvdO family nonheme iron enzyme [bacterium]
MKVRMAIIAGLAALASLQAEEPSPLPGFALVPGGAFQMGDHHDLGGREHRNDEVPVHRVRLNAFQMGATEVTNRQYRDYLNQALSQQLIEVREGAVYSRSGKYLYCDTRQSAPYSGIEWDGKTFTVLDGREDHPMVGVR